MKIASNSKVGWGVAALGAGAAAAVAIVWLVLTVETGLTFHLFPLLIVLAPAFAVAWRGGYAGRVWVPALLFGVPVVVVGWIYLESSGNAPTATFVSGQPGGVLGEVVLFTAIGVVTAPRLLRFVLEERE